MSLVVYCSSIGTQVSVICAEHSVYSIFPIFAGSYTSLMLGRGRPSFRTYSPARLRRGLVWRIHLSSYLWRHLGGKSHLCQRLGHCRAYVPQDTRVGLTIVSGGAVSGSIRAT